MGQTRRHFPQWTHLLSSQWTRRSEKKLIGLRNTVMGHRYLQNARLS